MNLNERRILYDKVTGKFPEFEHLGDVEKFVFLFTFDDAQMLSWLGKFLYQSFSSSTHHAIGHERFALSLMYP